MRQEFEKSIEEAKKFISKIEDSVHNFTHIKSVVKFAIKIAKKYDNVDTDLIEVAAWWHDVGRLYSEIHEKLSAEMAYKSLQELKVEEPVCKKVYYAIVFHKWSMQPKTIEGEIIRDADKLDFISIPRWKSCLDNNIEALQDLSNLLPRLRNEFLHLKISKKIYDNQIIKFKEFIQDIDKPNFFEVKDQILAYNL
jgi:putative nucleotidyltransferase with HDIG domain